MGAFCVNCAERVKDCAAARPLRRPFQRFCPKCGKRAEYTGEGFIIGGLLAAVFYNLYLCDELPIFGDIVGGALVGWGVIRFIRHASIKRTSQHAA